MGLPGRLSSDNSPSHLAVSPRIVIWDDLDADLLSNSSNSRIIDVDKMSPVNGKIGMHPNGRRDIAGKGVTLSVNTVPTGEIEFVQISGVREDENERSTNQEIRCLGAH